MDTKRNPRTGVVMVVFGVVVVCVLCSGAFGQPWDGNGVEGDPYQIWTAADMQAIGADENYWDAHFELMADIDLSAYTGTSFNIIGYYVSPSTQNPFAGVFDGNGHTISNFTYTSTGTNHIGLFGLASQSAKIKDLGLTNPNVDAGTGYRVGSLVGKTGGTIAGCYIEGGSVSGGDNVGGLAGLISECTMSNCYATGSVSGTTNVGGLVGHNGGYTITNCYSSGVVSGTTNVGGLVGTNEGVHARISNCYSTGSVSGDDNVGGLVGRNGEAVINCYSTGSVSGTTKVGGLVGYGVPACASFWDTQTSGQSTSGGGKGKTTAEMQTASTFIGWNGCGSEGVWVLDEGNDYPRLWWENKPGEPLPTESLSDFVAGAGTEQDPYLIETGDQMNLVGLFRCEWDKHFKLMADIDLAGITGTSFNIIGSTSVNLFNGVFDGNGHTISNFSYDSNNTDFIGIFGYLHNFAKIRDLGLINPNVDAGTGDYVGSLVAGVSRNGNTVTGCYTEGGSVSGDDYVGGLAGNGGYKISNCYYRGSVSGDRYVGGLVGFNQGGTDSTITNCYSTGTVSGVTEVGGLVGSNGGGYRPGRVTNCYSTASVSGVSDVGGLVGSLWGGEISNCYSTASVTGYWYVGGLVGSQLGGGISKCYSAGSVSGVSVVGGLLGYKEGGSITDSFWDNETSGQTTSAGGIGMPTELMQGAFIFTVAGWDFVGETTNGTEDIWYCDEPNYPRLSWEGVLSASIDMDEFWMYQGLPGQSNSDLTAGVSVTDDPMGNTTYSYAWEIVLPGDVTLAPTTAGGGGAGDGYWTFAARGCDEPGGLSDSGQVFTVRVIITGDDYGNTGQAEAEFGIALLGDTNNDGVVNVADRSITNAFWRTGSAGPYTLRDCDVNCDGVVNVADRSIANAIWRGILGQNSVSSPCPLR